MAVKRSIGNASTSAPSSESSESSMIINVKTLDSQVYSVQVNRKMLIPALKEKVARETGVPVEQQRLIFKGKVLKDRHMLSEYHVEEGDTLHLVTTPPVQPETSTGQSSGEVSRSIDNPTPRLSVGSLRVRGGGHNTVSRLHHGPGRNGATHTVIVGSANIPSPQMPIPDALQTLMEFMERLDNALSATGYWTSPSPTTGGYPHRDDLPSNAHGLPTSEALLFVLRRAERLLRGHAVYALSHIAACLEIGGGFTDPTRRNQIQIETVHVGRTMQHLGSLLLELGRTMLTLRMGQSPAESLVHPGPAVYISPSGPNPIMVQPFPLQASSLFGDLASSPPITGMMSGPIGSGGSSHSNVDIHVHTSPANPVNALSLHGIAPNSYQTHSFGVQNSDSDSVTSTTVQPPSSSSASSQESLIDSASLPALVARLNANIRNRIDRERENQVQSGQSEDPAPLNLFGNVVNHQEANVAVNGAEEEQQAKTDRDKSAPGDRNRSNEAPSSSKNVPMGLGMGGLQSLDSDGSNSNTRNANSTQVHQAQAQAQQVPAQAQQAQAQDQPSGQMGASSMLEIVNSPALNSLLTEMSQEAGMGSSPDGLRSALSQMIQRPAMRDALNQFGQQIQGNLTDPERLGFELSRVGQQLRPIIDEALAESEHGSAPVREPSYTPDPEPNRELQQRQQVDMLEETLARVLWGDHTQVISDNVLELVSSLISTEDLEDFASEMSTNMEFANDFMEMIRRMRQ